MDAEQSRVAQLTQYVNEQVLAGRRDALRRLLADDFVASGVLEYADRESWLTLMLDRTSFSAIEVSDVRTAMSFDDAVVVAAVVRPHGTRDGEPLDGLWRLIDIWQR